MGNPVTSVTRQKIKISESLLNQQIEPSCIWVTEGDTDDVN